MLRPTTSRVATDNPETMSFNVDKRVCEDSPRLAREKTRVRLLQSSRFHHLCRFIFGKLKSSTSVLTRSF